MAVKITLFDKIFSAMAPGSWKPKNRVEWIVLVIMGALSLVCSLLLAPYFLGVFMYPPAILVLALPGFFFAFLFHKRKYILIIAIEIILIVLLGMHSYDYTWRLIDITFDKIGIVRSDELPSGILNLTEDALPIEWYLSGRGKIDNDHENKIYTKEYHANVPLFGNYDSIRLTYYLQQTECPQFNMSSSEPAICAIGRCVSHKSNFETEDFISYAIDDNGSCVNLSFNLQHKNNALTQTQIIGIVDSLKRVPGQYTAQGFSERALLQMQTINEKVENSKKPDGSYSDVFVSFQDKATEEASCTSQVRIDIAPNKRTYMIHRPICPDSLMSYCIDSTQNEITTVPTSSLQKTYIPQVYKCQ